MGGFFGPDSTRQHYNTGASHNSEATIKIPLLSASAVRELNKEINKSQPLIIDTPAERAQKLAQTPPPELPYGRNSSVAKALDAPQETSVERWQWKTALQRQIATNGLRGAMRENTRPLPVVDRPAASETTDTRIRGNELVFRHSRHPAAATPELPTLPAQVLAEVKPAVTRPAWDAFTPRQANLALTAKAEQPALESPRRIPGQDSEIAQAVEVYTGAGGSIVDGIFAELQAAETDASARDEYIKAMVIIQETADSGPVADSDDIGEIDSYNEMLENVLSGLRRL